MIDFKSQARRGAPPPLPQPIATSEPDAGSVAGMTADRIPTISTMRRWDPSNLRERIPFVIRSLRGGCYLIRYTPNALRSFVHYDGTLRVERSRLNTTASGDLYVHWTLPWWGGAPEPSPSGIPVFPRSRYRYYVRVTQILEGYTLGNGFTLGYELHRLDQSTNTWTNEGSSSAYMTWDTPPSGYPSESDYLTGDVKDENGATLGTLTMAWVSPYLREAVVEVDRVQQSEFPEESGYEDGEDDIDWRYVYRQVGWNVSVIESDTNLAEPSGQSWSDAELHQEMLARRDSADLDAEWRYHLLCVRRLDSTSRGIMYDAFAGDSNNIPREGAAISSHWVIPNTAQWGKVRGQRFGAAEAPYFRTAVHELGHAMGLYHNTVDNGFMNTTGVIASNAGTFPDNVQWAFAPDDAKRLRHMPDPWVRPGMIPFGNAYGTAPISPDDMVAEVETVSIAVQPLLPAVPVGAPVRVEVTLTNDGTLPIEVPASLSLKSGSVSGKVSDASGAAAPFRPLIRCVDEHESRVLEPGESMSHSLTLLRGPTGALFPNPGTYDVSVDVRWGIAGVEMGATGRGHVMVTPPVDDEHATAALRVLSTPDTLLSLAIGGDHLEEGNAAVAAALDNPVLRPHFAIVEAKRVGRRFHKRKADVAKAAELLSDAVLSPSELKRAAEILGQEEKDKRSSKAYKSAVHRLKKEVAQATSDGDLSDIVKAL